MSGKLPPELADWRVRREVLVMIVEHLAAEGGSFGALAAPLASMIEQRGGGRVHVPRQFPLTQSALLQAAGSTAQGRLARVEARREASAGAERAADSPGPLATPSRPPETPGAMLLRPVSGGMTSDGGRWGRRTRIRSILPFARSVPVPLPARVGRLLLGLDAADVTDGSRRGVDDEGISEGPEAAMVVFESALTRRRRKAGVLDRILLSGASAGAWIRACAFLVATTAQGGEDWEIFPSESIDARAFKPPEGWSTEEMRSATCRPPPVESGRVETGTDTGSGIELGLTDVLLLSVPACISIRNVGEELRLWMAGADARGSEVRGAWGSGGASVGDVVDAAEEACGVAAASVGLVTFWLRRHLLFRLNASLRAEALEVIAGTLAAARAACRRARRVLEQTEAGEERTGKVDLVVLEGIGRAQMLLEDARKQSERLNAAGGGVGEEEEGSGGAAAAVSSGLASIGSMLAAPGEPSYHSWRKVPVQILAAQWTWQDHNAFSNLTPAELLEAGFDDPRDRHSADAVRACIDRYNAQWLWVAREIVCGPTPEARAAIFLRFLAIAVWLERYNNFSGLAAILSGLGASEIRRLKQTQALLPESAIERFKNLQKLMSPDFLSKKYFAALQKVPPGHAAVPHLAPHNQQILVKANTLSNEHPSNAKLLHVTRWRVLFELVAPLVELQERSYTEPDVVGAPVLDAPVRSICALLDEGLRPHFHRDNNDLSVDRARITERSKEVEP